ncbi:ATP-binding protein [Gorillibacterium sp. sgz5001074]|uniref:HAMP domain-containing sensor histidine kinase n=1 Tax=Gorillibacterium sp. sgz5001074 TaxID=3446695 RepID=UPI003F66C688
MFIAKNIVVKLWMTIIALVAVVLIILGLFLFRYIDSNFPKLDDQSNDLERLTFKIAAEAALKERDNDYIRAMNDLLGAQSIGMIVMETNGTERNTDLKSKPVPLNEVLSQEERSRLLRGEVFEKRFTPLSVHEKTDFLAVAVPVTSAKTAEIVGAVVMYQPMKASDNLQLFVKRLFAFVSFMGFLLTTFFAFFLITRLTRPLKQLKRAANLITQGEYATRVPVVSGDELGDLAQTFNLMGEQLEANINELNQEKNNLSGVLGSMSDAVMAFDAAGKVIFTNPRGQRILEEWSEIQWTEPDPDSGHADSHVPEPLQNLFVEVVEEIRPVYSKIHVQQGVWSIVMAPLYTLKQIRGAVAVLRDVTEEHRLEKLRKDFVANVSHELRTPLSMLQGYSEALLDDIVTTEEDRRDLAQVIHDESLRMGRLVKDLLDLARMEAGHMEMNMGEVQLSPLFKRVYRKFLTLTRDRDIQLEAEFPSEDVVLEQADQDRLEQVLTNLLDNAIRHTPAGKKIYLRYQTMSHLDSSAALIEIEDEGRGIPPDDLPYIFERFYKADKARTRGATGGTGLGLAIVKNIVEAHQGSVNVRSEVGQGTTFSIILPIRREA